MIVLVSIQGKFLPGVLVGHTAIGLQEEFIYERCKAVASLGYYAMAFDMFGGVRICVERSIQRNLIVHVSYDMYPDSNATKQSRRYIS